MPPGLPEPDRDSVDSEVILPVDADTKAQDQLNGEQSNDVKTVDPPSGRGEIEDPSDSEGSEEGGEYNVEAIRGHRIYKGVVLYEIKWQGYPEEENTDEPEENLLPHARQILADYHESIGGAPTTGLKKSKSKQSLRRQASTDDSPAPSAKRQKRNGSLGRPDLTESWTPTKEDWEPLVLKIETVEKDPSGQLVAYVVFNNGKKTKVGMDKIYRHCPRPMLKFYENHLKFS
ncbi:uncharacterized protein A1O9_05069 [Exophiala aquamarina CBS 119918]|uniref:Chromo domain-containing protein n=1 Tax=Exophiala aquamarina CBS 119918 TaxID=1182545 RepID=A0A072PJD8_9EURO|nr:uncharacterized protein A1O9_05069 [Exophiala aquamarina CBS 119918]KEF60219.1 hypothetical protein A1O9_05069 [Exophiala aquamarina CBS 119918]